MSNSFYEDHELEELARKAGRDDAEVERPDFEQSARHIGIPEEQLELLSGSGGQLRLAGKQEWAWRRITPKPSRKWARN